jgi:hypothetical protein
MFKVKITYNEVEVFNESYIPTLKELIFFQEDLGENKDEDFYEFVKLSHIIDICEKV